MAQKFKFELIHTSKKSKARVGKIYTPHGIINTPNFVGVGTNGTIKGLDNISLNSLNLELMFCNTYHLLLQPGSKEIKSFGGLHKFINRDKPIITDSGGFQVFSLAAGKVNNELKSRGQKNYANSILKISEEGVLFRSYRDGSKVLLTPESSIQAQKDFGSDIIIPLDELPAHDISEHNLRKSLARTHRWEKRSLEEHLKNPNNQAIYGVIHGGVNKDLRLFSAKYLSNLDFNGYAIGGSLGQNHQEMFEMLNFLTPNLPKDKPNHLLGIGDLKSIKTCIELGIDTMDSAYPTKCARHGLVFTSTGQERIIKSSNKNDLNPIDKNCDCFTCKNYTKAYLHHLFKAKETAGHTLATIHNLRFIINLFANYRRLILEDKI